MPAATRAAATRIIGVICACSRGDARYERPEAPAAASGSARLPRRLAPAGLPAAPPRQARAWHNPIEAPMSGRKRWTHLDQMVGNGAIYVANANDVTSARESAQVVSNLPLEISMFVTKEMNLAEWPVLQDRFADMQMTLGAPADFALFHRNHDGVQVSTIAASGLGLSRADALSPGGWSEVERLDGSGWAVLVGNGDVHTRLGVRVGKP